MSGITVTRRDDRLVAVKQATATGCERRRREAHLLARLGHPGVVEFVDLIEGDPTELHMTYAGTDSWERHPPTSEETIISGLAAVASTIADLHDLGTAHQSLAPEHVLVTSDHRPVLCGFADAEPADPFTCAEDLAGLAGLIGYVSPAAPADLRAQLGDLATRASTGELSARRLGEELLALHGRGREPTPRRAGVDRRLAAAAVAALAGLLFVGWWLAGPDRATTRVIASTSAVTPTSVTIPPSVATPPPSPPATVTVAPPTVETLEVQYGGRRFGIGRQGDIVLLGDWNCDGVSTPALLETALGRVAIFAVWPDVDASIGPETTIAMPGATDLQLVETDGCDQIRVVDPRGSTLFNPEFP